MGFHSLVSESIKKTLQVHIRFLIRWQRERERERVGRENKSGGERTRYGIALAYQNS